MRAWVIDDVEVFEVPFDYDLTAFEVYVGKTLKARFIRILWMT